MTDATLTMSDDPSAQLIAAAERKVVIKDETGRSITLKKPGVLMQYRLIEAVGADTAKNEVYMGMVLPLIFVTEIDGEAALFPSSKRQVEALIQRLGDEGVAAVMAGVRANFGAVDPEAERDALKK